MSNQAKEVEEGIAELGDAITFRKAGFKKGVRSEKPNLRRVGEHESPAPKQEKPKPKAKEKPKKEFDRITFEVTPEQRAKLSIIATSLNARVPREKRKEKINRDMVMRAVLSIAEKIKWDDGQELYTENDLRRFVSEQLTISKKATDKQESTC